MSTRRPTHEEIATRAYHIYLERGGGHGHDRDDWLQAEYELMQMPTEKLAKLTPQERSKPVRPTPLLIEVVREAMRTQEGTRRLGRR